MTADSLPASARDPLLSAFDRLAERAGGEAILVAPGHRVTVAQVDALARAAARSLPPGRGPVGLQAANGPGFLAALLALLRAQRPAVLLDRRTPSLERARIASEVGAEGVLLGRRAWASDANDFAWEPTGSEAADFPRGTAVVKLTSGSTGSARGIAVSSAALVADDAALTASMGIGADDRLLASIPFSHSYGLSSLVVPALVRGTPLILPAGEGPFAPLAAADKAGATVFPTVPAYLGALNRLHAPPPLPASLRLVLTAGAPLTAETSAGFRERFGLPVHVFYGASECGGICYDRQGGAAERGTVGSPVEGVTVDLRPLEVEAEVEGAEGGGRVAVSGAALGLGYVPEADPRLADGLYVTEDLAVWRDGELALVGRLNDLINIKGKKVNPREVERVLARLGGVEEALVLPAPAATGGDPRGDRVRAVVACPPGSLQASDVVAWCRQHLADHKVPRSVVLVDRLPRTERGKVDHRAVARLDGGDPTASNDPVPPPGESPSP